MVQPFMSSSLVFVPQLISLGGMIVLGLAGIKEFRQGHIGRVGIVVNVFLLWQIILPNWSSLSAGFQWYANAGTLFALISGPSYLIKKSLPTEFYNLAFLLYGSVSVLVAGLVLL